MDTARKAAPPAPPAEPTQVTKPATNGTATQSVSGNRLGGLVGGVKSGLQKHKNNRMIVAVGGLIVVLLVAGIGWHMWQKHQQQRAAAAKAAATTQQEHTTTSLHDAISDITNMKYDQAEADLAKAPDQTDRQVMDLKATVKADKQQYTDALALDRQIEAKYGLDASLAIQIALMAQATKDNKTAADYYQKALNLIDKQNPANKDSLKAYVQQQLAQIK